MITIIFIFFIFILLELLVRLLYSIKNKTYKQKGFIKALIYPLKFNYSIYNNFFNIDKNKKIKDFRFDSQISLMGLKQDEFINNLAKANNVSYSSIKKAYTGNHAFEKLKYEAFIGFNNQKNMSLSYAKTNNFSYQDTSKKKSNTKVIIKKVFLVGGSVAFGFGASAINNNITNMLDKYLNENEKNDLVKWEILNFSFISCQSTSEMNIINKYIKDYKPEYVIQLSGFNDLFFYLNNNFRLYQFNKSDEIYDYLYSTFAKKILYKLSSRIFLIKLIYKLIYEKIKFEDRNNIYTIY